MDWKSRVTRLRLAQRNHDVLHLVRKSTYKPLFLNLLLIKLATKAPQWTEREDGFLLNMSLLKLQT